MRVDIHVHTNKYSACGVSTPDEMIQAAIDSGLDAIVLTEHDYMWQPRELAALQARYTQIKLFAGIEVSIDDEEHIVVVGVPDPSLFHPFMSPTELIAAVRRHGGAAVLAHPFRWSQAVRRDILDAGFDAIEISSNSIRNYMQEPITKLQNQLQLPLVASSDGHHTRGLGLYAIELERPAQDDSELARMIRQGQFSPWHNPQRIETLNAQITAALVEVSRLIENGLDTREALRKVGLSGTLTYAVKNNLDIRYPKGVIM